jgi:hypothetical protein
MNLGDVERQLRAGPPEEGDYQVRPLMLDLEPAAAARGFTAVPRTRPGLSDGLRLVATGLAVAALVGAFVVGRLSAGPSGPAGPAGAPPSVMQVQPAMVSEALRQAFYSGVDRQTSWLVCSVGSTMTCADALAYRTAEPLSEDEWPHVQPVTVPAGDVVVGAALDPRLTVMAYLLPADNPSAAGPQLVPASMIPGDTFLDLGELRPGRYVLSILSEPNSPMMSGQIVIGLVVQ